jgi:hypothetical protein
MTAITLVNNNNLFARNVSTINIVHCVTICVLCCSLSQTVLCIDYLRPLIFAGIVIKFAKEKEGPLYFVSGVCLFCGNLGLKLIRMSTYNSDKCFSKIHFMLSFK